MIDREVRGANVEEVHAAGSAEMARARCFYSMCLSELVIDKSPRSPQGPNASCRRCPGRKYNGRRGRGDSCEREEAMSNWVMCVVTRLIGASFDLSLTAT